MRILAIGDPHGVLPKGLNNIIRKNKIELIVCIGEVFPIIRNKDGTGKVDLKKGEDIIDKICSYKIPVIIFKGNMFLNEKGAKYFKNLIENRKRKYKNFNYKEIGKLKVRGKKFILFDMIYEKHSHQSIDKKWWSNERNNKRSMRLTKLLKENKEAILLSHAPPYKILDKTRAGKHIGSKILLSAIKKYPPRIVLCGHVHEAVGEKRIRKTKVINLGCCGKYKIIQG